jgi:hypothetical protein
MKSCDLQHRSTTFFCCCCSAVWVQANGAASRALLAVRIALEHPQLTSHPGVLCAAACVCKDWQEAVQQCGVRSTDAELRLVIYKGAPQNLHSFGSWLQKHAHLLRSISVSFNNQGTLKHNLSVQLASAEPAAQLMQRALEAAAAAVPPTIAASTAMTSAAAAAAAATQGVGGTPAADTLGTGHWLSSYDMPKQQQQQQQQQGMQLASFSTDCLLFPGVLAALPAHSLTHLDLSQGLLRECRNQKGHQHLTGCDGPALTAALAQLSSLRQLHIRGVSDVIPGSCLAGIAQLRHLTLLEFEGRWQDTVEESLLQLLAQPLPLRELRIAFVWPKCCKMDLAQLTQLQLLHSNAVLSEGSVLPEQMQSLKLHSLYDGQGLVAAGFSAVLSLQLLQRLELKVGFQDPLLLQQLAALPALQHLVLVYESASKAVATASAWAQLPQLRELWLRLTKEYRFRVRTSSRRFAAASDVSAAQVEALAAGAAAAAGLTKLMLSVQTRQDEDGAAAVCSELARLASLKQLVIYGPRLVPGDAVALTALTRLTCLNMRYVGAGVDVAAATALARSLRQLRYLVLPLAPCHVGCEEFTTAVAEISPSGQLRPKHLDG